MAPDQKGAATCLAGRACPGLRACLTSAPHAGLPSGCWTRRGFVRSLGASVGLLIALDLRPRGTGPEPHPGYVAPPVCPGASSCPKRGKRAAEARRPCLLLQAGAQPPDRPHTQPPKSFTLHMSLLRSSPRGQGQPVQGGCIQHWRRITVTLGATPQPCCRATQRRGLPGAERGPHIPAGQAPSPWPRLRVELAF